MVTMPNRVRYLAAILYPLSVKKPKKPQRYFIFKTVFHSILSIMPRTNDTGVYLIFCRERSNNNFIILFFL
jgi:hypothetical protein